MEQLEIAGVKCLKIKSDDQIMDQIEYFLKHKIGTYSVAINAEKIIRCKDDPSFKEIVNNSLFQVPDGVAALILIRKKYKVRVKKIDLPSLSLKYCNAKKIKLAIIGANEVNNATAFEKIGILYKDIELCGRLNGYNSLEQIIDFIEDKKPQIILLGLGSPKQELFSKELIQRFPKLIIINCGGAIDVISGFTKRAPKIIQKLNIEWLYRLVSNPSRIKRQIKLFRIIPLFFRIKKI
jgi:N-acetylglucosaminyldiphosphoundecaprenol N-acetyl-beta-D-mannosaminyltransferase